MQQTFEQALACVLASEGGYVDHPLDPGGATNRGITQATLAGVRGRRVSKAEVRALSLAETGEIYRRLYWSAVRADDLPSGVDFVVFDLAVNSGPRRATLILQQALGVAQDGILGPQTLAACRASYPPDLIGAVSDARLRFLQALPTWATFGRGWSRRVEEVRRQSLALATARAAAPANLPKLQPEKKESVMTNVKSILASRTVWSNVVGLTALGLATAGFDTKALDVGGVVDAGLQVVAGASFIASTIFRVVATRKLMT
jgi:lysozyme family protein